MADAKISALPAATTPLAGTEVLPIVQSGATKKVSVDDLTAGKSVSASSLTTTGAASFGTTSGNVGINTSTPTNALSFGGNAAQTIWLERHSTSNTAGNNLTIQAGGATSGATDKNGGNLVLSSGTGTGTGASLIQFFTSTGGTTGSSDNTPTEKVRISPSGNFGIGSTNPGRLLVLDGKAGGAVLQMTNNAAGNVAGTGYEVVFDGTNTYLNHRPNGFISFITNSVERARLDANGNLVIIGTGGIGYGAGSGGAVTQDTSRTTGVTIDKTNGSITLVSAAGTTAWQSFTVTNNKVLATDTIIVSQRSGTDLYQIFVTNVASGSFRITFATTGGTTTEQPIFSFAIVRAVVS